MAPIDFETEDKLEYNFFPAGQDGVVFRVRAANDAHLALTTNEAESDPMIEVFIGGWKNTKSVIRKNRSKPDVAEFESGDLLDAGEFRGFWIKWTENVITVGKEGEAAAFLSYENTESFPINFVGICSGWGASASWIIEAPTSRVTRSAGGSASWVPGNGSDIPAGAVAGGEDNGQVLFVGRASHEGAIIPGKIVPSHGVLYLPWGGVENSKSEFEVLVGSPGSWIAVSGGDIPPTAQVGGESEDGEPLFIGRVQHEGTVTIGKVQPSHGCCYISYAGQELAFNDYEILTY